ncbi:MAG: single-stranded DNA-binding protein [Clostridiales bacterium]|nr:single-stranded DNA-binding protein [Clostridiales bacterium]
MYNKAILIGRLTADPELKQTPNGVSVCSFSIACDRPFSSKSGEKQTDFINIVAWRQNAEFVSRYFSKGRLIGIDGSIQTRNYEDKNGNRRTAVEVVADRAFFVDSKSSASASSAPSAQNFNRPAAPAEPISYSSGSFSDFEEIEGEDDLPF